MKPVIDYANTNLQMGDLLLTMGISSGKDIPMWRRKRLIKQLERYMSGNDCCNEIRLNMGKFFLLIKGSDEASHLYQYLI